MPTIQYRKLDRNKFSYSGTLQDAIEACLDMDGRDAKIGVAVKERLIDLRQDGRTTVLNGFHAPKLSGGGDIFSGQIFLYRQGTDIPAIEEDLDSDLEVFLVKNYKTSDKMKPIEGVLHFVVFGDHVGLIEARSVKSKWLENYLTWLLKSATDIISDQSLIELLARFSSGSGTTPPSRAKQIIMPARAVTRKGASETVARGRKAGATVTGILKLLGWDEKEIDSLLKDLPDGTDLHGDLRVYAKKGGRNVEFKRQAIESAFRNSDPDDISLSTDQGNQKGRIYKLSETRHVKRVNSMLLDPGEATVAIWEQLKEWAKTGRIDMKL